MEGLKAHIRRVMLWEFKQGNSAMETAEKYVVCMARAP